MGCTMQVGLGWTRTEGKISVSAALTSWKQKQNILNGREINKRCGSEVPTSEDNNRCGRDL